MCSVRGNSCKFRFQSENRKRKLDLPQDKKPQYIKICLDELIYNLKRLTTQPSISVSTQNLISPLTHNNYVILKHPQTVKNRTITKQKSTLTSWGWARARPRLRQLAWSYDLIRVKLKKIIWSKNSFWKKILRIYFVKDLMANWWIAKILVLFFFLRPTFTFEPTFPFKLFQSDLKPLRYLQLAIVTYS